MESAKINVNLGLKNMDEKPKNLWRKSWSGWRWLRAWLIFALATFVIALIVGWLTSWLTNFFRLSFREWLSVSGIIFLYSAIIATLFLWLWMFIRWLFCRRNLKRSLFGLACFVTLVALFYAEENWRGKHEWQKFQDEWKAKGENFDYASLVPPAVPNDQNFAMAPIIVESIEAAGGSNVTRQWFDKSLTGRERSNLVNRLDCQLLASIEKGPTNGFGSWQKSHLTRLEPWQNYYRTLATETNLFPVSPQPQTPAQDVLLALSKYDPVVEELRQANQRPYAQFPVYSNPDLPFDTLLPHLAMLKHCTQFLHLRAVAELQNNHSQAALDDVKLMLRLTESLRGEPYLISQLVRLAMLEYDLQPIYEGLTERQWSDAQLAELDVELAKLDFLADYQHSMRGERVCAITTIDYVRKTRNLGMLGGDNPSEISPIRNLLWLVPSGWFYLNDLALAQMNQLVLLPLADVQDRIVSPGAVRRANDAETDLVTKSPRVAFIAKQIYPALSGVVQKFAFAQEAVDLSRVAIALERYRLAHGKYPESLAALTPRFIKKFPHDIITGQPLKYRCEADGKFILYSVGWNETDDGGVVVCDKKTGAVHQKEGDWVWRYPAK